MQVKSEKQGSCVYVKLIGELDHHAAKQTREELDALLTTDVKRMSLDLSELTLMDSSGIGVIIGRYKILSARGGSITVMKANEQAEKILRMAGLYNILKKS